MNLPARAGRTAHALLAAATLLSLTPGLAQAQMPDPSAMSGIPRPDGSVAPGSLVARVIRGDFAHPMVDAEVVADGPGGKKTARVGADGRATFTGLAVGGTYRLSSTSGDQTVTSLDIPMPAEAGVKVMLVFKADASAPAPAAAGTPAASAAASVLGPAASGDAGGLTINRRSHIILEVKDEAVEVMENFFVTNPGPGPIDPGPEGIVFVLPAAAQGATAVGEAPANVTVAGGRAVLQGPIATGETAVPIGFVLPLHGATVELRQTLPLRMEALVGITSDFPGMEVRGDGLSTQPRELSGRKFKLINGGAVEKGGELRVTIAGLPHRSPTAAYVAVTLAILVALWGLWAGFAARGGGEGDERGRLQAEKRQLLDELAALERHKAGTSKAGAKQQRRAGELGEKLERVMRDLDDYAD